MLPAVASWSFPWPSGRSGWLPLHGVGWSRTGSVLHGSSFPVSKFKRASSSPRSPCALLRPLLTSDRASAAGSPQVRTRCFPAQPPHLPPRLKPLDFGRRGDLVRRVGLSMRFLFIGSPVSHSLPPPGRLPSRSWLLVVVSFHVSMFGSPTGDFHPIYNAPMLGAHNTMHAKPPKARVLKFRSLRRLGDRCRSVCDKGLMRPAGSCTV